MIVSGVLRHFRRLLPVILRVFVAIAIPEAMTARAAFITIPVKTSLMMKVPSPDKSHQAAKGNNGGSKAD